jgi:hypothetical protein
MIYALFLFLRSVDMAIDYTSEMILNNNNNILREISVRSLITFYFLENIPSIVLMLTLYMKLKSSNKKVISDTSDSSSNQDSLLMDKNIFDSTDTYAK